jgi:thioredoxin reductase (NADPH)
MADLQAGASVDCLIIGGGPAGLTAAIYIARFHLSVIVIDAGDSRAAKIPLTRNHAGFPGGISGTDLLSRMRAQAETYSAVMHHDTVTSLVREADGFRATTTASGLVFARSVLLATGVVNRRPNMIDSDTHDRALSAGLLRYCPVCDGYEVTDQAVAVVGTGERGCTEALFLRSYTADVTLVAPDGGHELSSAQLAQLHEGNVTIAGACERIAAAGEAIVLTIEGRPTAFDTLYPALGSDIRSELAAQVGARTSEDGCLLVDTHQRTDVEGLYAAGDVVLGLDQISHAMGEGGVAATTIRNDLARRTPLRR